MTDIPTTPLITARELKAIAKSINLQMCELTNQVSTVRHLLYQEARRMKKATGPSSRAFSRSKGAPITVIHAKGRVDVLQGHPKLVASGPTADGAGDGSA